MGLPNNCQHQKSDKTSATTSNVSKIRRGISGPLFTREDDAGDVVSGSLTAGVEAAVAAGS
jgi:hypothetical protein